MRYHKIPDETVRRLPVYLRAVLLLSQQGQQKASSKVLADFVGIHPWQIRKDFSYFGDFGTPGVGYNIESLSKQIFRILRLDTRHNAALVGVGNLGSALIAYHGFEKYNFSIIAAFDSDSKKIGRKKGGILIEDISQIPSIKKRNIDLGIIAVPPQASQHIADALIEAGIKGILNFSSYNISVPKKIKVITIDIAMDLARLPYYVPAASRAINKKKVLV